MIFNNNCFSCSLTCTSSIFSIVLFKLYVIFDKFSMPIPKSTEFLIAEYSCSFKSFSANILSRIYSFVIMFGNLSASIKKQTIKTYLIRPVR